MRLQETGYGPVYYFPRADVRMDLLHRTTYHSHCPFRGNASYWSLAVDERTAKNAAWSYEDPFDEAADIKDYIAFDSELMDSVYAEGEADLVKGAAAARSQANPLAEWLFRDAWHAASSRELVGQLTRCLMDAGIPVWRLWLVIRTLHPLLFSMTYTWERNGSSVSERQMAHGILQTPAFLNSPLVPIFEGAGGVRRRLDIPNPQLDYPIVKKYHAAGATDYVAMPLLFSDGQINAISLTSDRPGGFTTDDLGHVYEILPLLSRLLEVHAMRRTAVTLLDTYLGKHTGGKVLNGLIKRGDGEDIHAVIWFCDLRNSTLLADSMSREAFLGVLNRFFDCMAGAVLDHGGEVLRFIGDAALAIFPCGDPSGHSEGRHPCPPERCATALAAALDARKRLEMVNHERRKQGWQPLKFGLALHIGDVTYGNIGTPERLEFTVIGAAANRAARIEDLCKALDKSILMSAEFARCLPGEFVSLGHHYLRGLNEEQEVFTPADD